MNPDEPHIIEASVLYDAETCEYYTRLKTPAGNTVIPFMLPSTTNLLQDLNRLQQGIIRSLQPEKVRGTAGLEPSMDFGCRLFQSLFAKDGLDLYWESRRLLEQFTEINQRLIIKINPTTYELASLPWELLYDPAEIGILGFLAFNRRTPVIRHIADRSPRQLITDREWRVLLVSSNPLDTDQLKLEEEEKIIQNVFINEAPDINLRIEALRSPSPHELIARLRTVDPHILHFMGHGAPGRLLLDDPSKTASMALHDDNLALTLNNIPSLRLVFLNACETGAAESQENLGMAYTLSQVGIPAVIANQFPAFDDAARMMSREFYSSLASGLPVDEALLWGRINVQGIRRDRRTPTLEWATPVLYLQTKNGYLFKDLFQQARKPQSGAKTFQTQTTTFQVSFTAELEDVHEHVGHIQTLIKNNQRRLQVLEEQRTFYGKLTPPYVVLEIEDTEQEIAKLKAELAQLQEKFNAATSVSAEESQKGPITLDEAQRLRQLYTSAGQAIEAKEWGRAANLLEQVISIDKHYEDAVQLRHFATLQPFLSAVYEKAMLAYETSDWSTAIAEFQNILSQQADYEDASKKLDEAKLQLRRDGWYDEGLTYIDRKEWSKAIEVLNQIKTSEGRRRNLPYDLDYARAMQLFAQAQERTTYSSDHESDWQSVKDLLIPLAERTYRDTVKILGKVKNYATWLERYREGERQLEQENWQAAVQTFESINRESQDKYRDSSTLLQKAKIQLKLTEHYEQGRQYLQQQRWRKARAEFQEILKIDEHYRDAAALSEQTTREIELADKYEKAKHAYSDGNYNEAITTLEKLLAEAPDYRDGQARLELKQWQTEREVQQAYDNGVDHMQPGSWQTAIAEFEKVLKLEPKGYRNTAVELERARQEQRLETAYNTAKRSIDAAEWESAIKELRKLQELQRDYRDTTVLLKRVEANHIKNLYDQTHHWQDMEEWDKAETVLKKIQQLRPDDEQVSQELDRVYHQQQIAKWRTKAIQASDAKKWSTAIEFFEKIRAEGGDFQELEPRYEQARRCLRLDTLDEQVKTVLIKNNLDEAEKLLEEIKEINPGYRDVQNRLATVRRQKLLVKLFQEGQIAFEEANWPVAINAFKQVVDINDAYEDAAEKLEQAKQAQHLSNLYHEAEQLVTNQQWQDAINLYQSILGESENYRDVKDKLTRTKQLLQLHNLYDSAIQCQAKNDLNSALDFFQNILDIDLNFADAAEKLAEVTQSLELEDRYKKAMAAISENRYSDAVSLLESITAAQSDFKNSAQILEKAKKEARLNALYKRGQESYQQGNWPEAIQAFEETLGLAPEYHDVSEKLKEAERQLRWDKTYQEAQTHLERQDWTKAIERLIQIEPDERYRKGLSLDLAYAQAMNAYKQAQDNLANGKDTSLDWQAAIDLLVPLAERGANYRDTKVTLQTARQYLKWNELYTRGQGFFSNENWNKAVATFETITQENREYRDVLLRLEEAKRQQSLAEHYSHGIQYLQLGSSLQEARDEFKAVIELDPDYLDAQLQLERIETEQRLIELFSQAMRHYGENNRDAAITALEQVVKEAPNFDNGKAKTRLDQWQKERDVRQAYEQGTDFAEKGQWLAAANALEKAEGFLDATVRLEQVRFEIKLEQLYGEATELIEQEQWQPANSTLKEIQSLQENYKNVSALINEAEEALWLQTQYKQVEQYQANMELGKAIVVLEGIQRRRPDDKAVNQHLQELKLQQQLESWYSEAQSAIAGENWAKACHALQKIKDLGRVGYKDVETLYKLAERNQQLVELYAKADAALQHLNLDQAEELLNAASEIDSGYLDVQVKLLSIRRQKRLIELSHQAQDAVDGENWEEAIQAYQQIIDVDPGNENVVEKLKRARLLKGLAPIYASAQEALTRQDWTQAVRHLETIVSQDENYKDTKVRLEQVRQNEIIQTHYQTARKNEELGNLPEALSGYQAILQIDPEFEDIAQKITALEKTTELLELYHTAQTYLEARDFVKAVPKLQRLVEQDPGYEDAKEILAKAIEDQVAGLLDKYQRAEEMEKQKRYKEANKLYLEYQQEKEASPWL